MVRWSGCPSGYSRGNMLEVRIDVSKKKITSKIQMKATSILWLDVSGEDKLKWICIQEMKLSHCKWTGGGEGRWGGSVGVGNAKAGAGDSCIPFV